MGSQIKSLFRIVIPNTPVMPKSDSQRVERPQSGNPLKQLLVWTSAIDILLAVSTFLLKSLKLNLYLKICLCILALIQVLCKVNLLDFRNMQTKVRSSEIYYVVILTTSGACVMIGWYASRTLCEKECARDMSLFLYHYGCLIVVPIITLLLCALSLHAERKRDIQYCCVGGGVGDGVGNA